MFVWAGLIVVFAGIAGACGVAAAAAASHGAAGPDLSIAAPFLMVHAAALLALALSATAPRAGYLGAATLMAIGLTLFAGDLAVRAFGGPRLFPMAAPTGGTLLILSWVAVALVAIVGLFQRSH